MVRAVLALFALGLLVGGGFVLNAYPYRPVLLTLLLVSYSLAIGWKPEAWLFLLPLLLPTLDWAPWSGSLMVEEFDFFVLATIAIGYVRLSSTLFSRLSISAWLFLALGALFCFGLMSAWATGAQTVLWTADYLDPLNGWRVARGFLWALLLYPLIPATLAHRPDALQRYFLPGMAAALGLVSLVALWERIAFPGLLDFTSDYRITAGFSGMHVGGAGLDGFLALTLPLALGWAVTARSRLRLGLGLVILVLAIYAVLVTFSRGLYLGLILAGIVTLALWALRPERGNRGRLGLIAALCLFSAWALLHAYPQGGLRVLGAGLAALASSALIAGLSRRVLHGAWFWLGALVFALLTTIAVLASDKGVYVVAAFAFAMLSFGLWPAQVEPGTVAKMRAATAATGVAGMWVCVLGIAAHHGGETAALDAVYIVVAAIALVVLNRRIRPRLWEIGRTTYLGLILSVVVLGLTIPIAGNYYMKGRFAQSDKDWQTRVRHWRSILEIMPTSLSTELFGAGAGKLPEYYFWRNPKHDVPGSFQVRSEAATHFVRLGAPHYVQGYGEALRYGQRIAPSEHGVMVLMLKARASAPKSQLYIEICDKLLLYPRYPCLRQVLSFAQANTWQAFNIPFGTSPLGRGLPIWRPVQFSMYNESAGSYIDVAEVSLIDAAGENVIANGDFSEGEKRWFFSSDHSHLPWHAKNIWLHLYFEQGWLGVILFAALVGFALYHLSRARSHALATMLFAGIIGFLAVGLFDSLLDMPRVALLFFLSVAIALNIKPAPIALDAPIMPGHSPAPDKAKLRRRGRRGR